MVNGRCLGRATTGVERYTAEVTQRLSDKLTVIRPTTIANGFAGHIWEQWRLPRLLRRRDLLWSPANTGPVSVARQVVTIHDVSPLDHPEWFHPLFARWYAFVLPRLARQVRRIITDSEFSRTRIVERLRVPDARVVSIPCGVSGRFSPRPLEEVQQVRARYALTRPYVLTVGSLQPRKNLRGLVHAWAQAQPACGSFELVVAGAARANFAGAGIGDLPAGVRFLGVVDDESLPALYTGALFVAVPSFYEGFGLPALEAMSCGAAVLAATGGALDEVVGDAGVRVSPYDVEEMAVALRELLSDPSLRERFAARGLARARKFSWDQTASRTWTVLEDAND